MWLHNLHYGALGNEPKRRKDANSTQWKRLSEVSNTGLLGVDFSQISKKCGRDLTEYYSMRSV